MRQAKGEGRQFQEADGVLDSLQRPLGNVKIAGGTFQFTLKNEIEKHLQVFGGSRIELNGVGHSLFDRV